MDGLDVPNLISYDEVLQQTNDQRFLLLGNGFSCSLCDSLSYGNLFDGVADRLSDQARELFEELETTSFEAIMRTLLGASSTYKKYYPQADDSLLAEDINTIKGSANRVCFRKASY